jgi:hypothetical protein
MAKKDSKVIKQIPRETTVYIGKSLPILPQYTVFKGGKLPAYVEELTAKDETVAGLIVPVSELQEARKNMHVKGHILNYYFNKQNIKEV